MARRTPWRAAPSRDPGSSTKPAAQRLSIFLEGLGPGSARRLRRLVRDTRLRTSSMAKTSSMAWRTPDRAARSAIARSGVQRETGRAAAQYLFLKNWVPDRRGGFAATCPGHEAADVIYGLAYPGPRGA